MAVLDYLAISPVFRRGEVQCEVIARVVGDVDPFRVPEDRLDRPLDVSWNPGLANSVLASLLPAAVHLPLLQDPFQRQQLAVVGWHPVSAVV
jgi:hypothetical protein